MYSVHKDLYSNANKKSSKNENSSFSYAGKGTYQRVGYIQSEHTMDEFVNEDTTINFTKCDIFISTHSDDYHFTTVKHLKFKVIKNKVLTRVKSITDEKYSNTIYPIKNYVIQKDQLADYDFYDNQELSALTQWRESRLSLDLDLFIITKSMEDIELSLEYLEMEKQNLRDKRELVESFVQENSNEYVIRNELFEGQSFEFVGLKKQDSLDQKEVRIKRSKFDCFIKSINCSTDPIINYEVNIDTYDKWIYFFESLNDVSSIRSA